MALTDFPQLRASLSYSDIERATGWKNPVIINDYLNISEETTRIINQVDTNTNSIDSNTTIFDSHESSSSEHGVTGDNVGNEDFSTDLIAGVVLLMDLVADAVASTQEVTLPDVAVAPALYSQTYADAQTTLVNDVKAKHNAMLLDLNSSIVQLNELISNSITAKQMSAT